MAGPEILVPKWPFDEPLAHEIAKREWGATLVELRSIPVGPDVEAMATVQRNVNARGT